MQDQERRNAENLSESVGISARAMQRFLTEARWSDETVIGRLQEYLAPRLGHPEAVWVFDGSDFPKQGRKSAGVARQYCGRLGKVANCQGGMFLAYVSPLGRALVDKRLYLPKSWTSDQDRCAAAGVPEDRRNYRSKTELALEMLERVLELGYLRAEWVAGDDAFGMSPTFREGLAALGMRYVLDVPGGTTVWPLDLDQSGISGVRPPPQTQAAAWAAADHGAARDELPDEAWREITVAQGSQGPRPVCPAGAGHQEAQARRGTVGRLAPEPGRQRAPLLPVQRSRGHNLGDWPTWVGPGGALKRSSRLRRVTWLDEYETRSWAGWHHHIAMCLLGGAFLLSLQQDWGEKDAPDHEAKTREMLPREQFGPQLLLWLEGTGSPFPRETPLHPPRKQAPP